MRMKAEIGDVPGSSLIDFMKLDLSSFVQIKSFADDFIAKEIQLDIMILNAGLLTPEFALTADGLEMVIGTNHFGHFLLVKLLTPIIESSRARLVVVSSAAHMTTYPEGLRFETFKSDANYIPL
jgi:NAD(P)-dependent dehydrogenase (short-subunit alcohol dehydrogenase family)